MSARRPKPSRPSSSRKARGAGRFAMEGLEAREMMAADALQAATTGLSTPQPQAVLVGPAVAGPQVGPVQYTTSAFTFDAPITRTTGELYVDPTPGPVLGAKLENGVLSVTGSHNADNVFIFARNGLIEVREVVSETTLLSVPQSQVQSIVVHANGGNDWVKVDHETIAVPTSLFGEGGDDTLQGGAGSDSLYGGSGNDELLGYAGGDTLKGEQGDDLLIGGAGADYLFGGAGNDYLVGGDGNDILQGEDGNDQLFGEGGSDSLFGGAGQNLLDGGAGNDYLYGGDDIDAIYGGDGNDNIRAFGGDDRIRGEGGDDTVDAGLGNDIIDGGIGNDYLDGKGGNDVISGDLGNDTLFGNDDQDWLDGNIGSDTLYGGNGNDWLQGGVGIDTVNGGAGSNKVYQDYAPGYLELGTVTQSLSWGDVGDFFGDVWDGITGAFNWVLDKAESIGLRFYEWASHIDDRLWRLGQDLAGALSNWPWEADFWKGLGRSVIDVLEVAGIGEIWETAFEILKPWQRGMTAAEIAVAKTVFGDSINYSMVRLDEHSLMAWIGRTHVTGYIINSTENIDDRTMIHELTHVWQYQQDGLAYIPEALGGQHSDEAYDFGGLAGLQAKMAAGQTIGAFNPEQQGEIIATYYDKRQYIKTQYESQGLIAPSALRQELDVYIYFVKQVSTLTHAQLDTPDPVVVQPPVFTGGGTLAPPSKTGGTTTPTSPVAPTSPLSPRGAVTTAPAMTFTVWGDLNDDGQVDALDEAVRTLAETRRTPTSVGASAGTTVSTRSLDAALASF